ncbi:kinase-like domain-containing protein, partial [Dunaliella salina]
MEFCRSTLSAALKAGPLPEEERWHVLRGVLQGLAHLHAAGIIHRDLKPDNVFYDAKNQIKLGDFGLAKQLTTDFQQQQQQQQQQQPIDLQHPPASRTSHPGIATGTVPATNSPRNPITSPTSTPRTNMRGANNAVNGMGGADVGGIGGGGAFVGNGGPAATAAAAAGGVSQCAFTHPSLEAPQHSSLLSEQTGVIGTSFYIAPEIQEGWASYDEKVDLFSLGVVIFELWHPFATEMERVIHLRALRESGHMPEAWKAQHAGIAHLVSWLMKRSPRERPTAAEVLSTPGALPPRQDEQAVGDLLRSLPDAPETVARVLGGVFELGASRSALRVNAAGAGHPKPDAMFALAARDTVIAVVKSVFGGRHGAVAMSSLQVGYARTPPPHRDAVHLLTQGGALLALRRDLRTPFVHWMAQHAAGQSQLASCVCFLYGSWLSPRPAVSSVGFEGLFVRPCLLAC